MPDNYPEPPTQEVNNSSEKPSENLKPTVEKWPYDSSRIQEYEFNERLFMGHHFDAFNIRMSSAAFGKEYAKLRYIVANFPGLISKICADLLFIEPPKITTEDGDQKFIDELVSENHLRTQCYESALANSYYGDTVFKLRVGKRNPTDEKSTVIIEEITPKIYFPKVNPYNVKAEPEETVLAWKVSIGGKEYIRKEIHTAGKIQNKVYELTGDEIGAEVDVAILGIPGMKDEEATQIKKPLIVHVANFRAGAKYFGLSDYYDLVTLFFAINNRITKVDNILDKHSDPILAIPAGILDEDGKVKRSELNMFARPQDATKDNDPAYITWEANLESAMKEIDKLVELTFMMSETAPDILGMGQGQSDSGRALKFKLIRTLAKVQRKQLYYTEGLREVIYRAQLLAKAWNLDVNGVKLTKEAVRPEIVWRDGLPADMTELIDIETKRIDAGLTSEAEAIARLEDIDVEAAEEKAKKIKEANKLKMPAMNVAADANRFGNKPDQTGTPVVKPKPTE